MDSVQFFPQPVSLDIIIIYNSTDAMLMKQTGIAVWRQRLEFNGSSHNGGKFKFSNRYLLIIHYSEGFYWVMNTTYDHNACQSTDLLYNISMASVLV